MKCHINIIWFDIYTRDTLFELLVPLTKKFSASTEADHLTPPEYNQDRISVNVYAAKFVEAHAQMIADRVADLFVSRDVHYLALDLRGVSQDRYHEWLATLQDRLPGQLFVFDPTVRGPVFDKLIAEASAT